MSWNGRAKQGKHRDFRRACRFLGPYRRLVIISVCCAVLTGGIMTAGLGAIYPILKVLIQGQSVQQWVESQIPVGPGVEPAWYWRVARTAASYVPTHPVGAIAVMFVAIAILAAIGNVFRFFHEFFSDLAAINAVNDIRKRLYDHVLHIPLAFFGLKGTSDVTSRLVQDCQGLQDGFKILLGQSVLEPIRAAMAMAVAIAIDWRLTLFIVLFAPVLAVVMKKFGKKMRRASRAALESSSAMLGQIEGTLSGIRLVKAANAERFERRRYASIMDSLRREQLKMARYEAISTPVMETVAMWVAGGVLIFAAYLMFVDKSLNVPGFMLIMACLVTIGEAARRLSKLNNVIQRSNAAAARIFETLDIPVERPRVTSRLTGLGHDHTPAARHPEALIKLPPIQREVRFERVTFSYPNTSTPALLDVDLVVPRGASVAIVGRNGSGKTTLLAMLPRFYDPDRGRVCIDGIDLRTVTLRSLRRQIAIVTQDSVIFPGTIAQNIAYGLPLATREQIQDAAKRAFAHEFIMEKPLGYDTPLDGLGGQLSGGQKQRLNIARAILRQAPILILDEATSQVD
ncbi:MAG TPA: ABC transporter ATP-binding protein, partial [Tepidisphaeraceae bacterium]|nr:ABC transporter ATP-binding protein [Tepidisphaeraceae bacterium]